MVRLLLDRGANVLAQRDFPVNVAAKNAHVAVAKLLLERGASLRVRKAWPQWSAGVLVGHLQAARYIVDLCADYIHVEHELMLRAAAQHGKLGTVRFLLEHGADVHTWNNMPLQIAVQNGHLQVVTLLLDNGANVHADNERALRIARNREHAAIVALLLARGALKPEPEED